MPVAPALLMNTASGGAPGSCITELLGDQNGDGGVPHTIIPPGCNSNSPPKPNVAAVAREIYIGLADAR